MTFGRWRELVAAVGILSLLAGCGGGGAGGDSDAVCADFAYQEDAQSAYSAGATQLDRDKDGIACEDLPSRPIAGGGNGSGSGSGGGSGVPLTVSPWYVLMDTNGVLTTFDTLSDGSHQAAYEPVDGSGASGRATWEYNNVDGQYTVTVGAAAWKFWANGGAATGLTAIPGKSLAQALGAVQNLGEVSLQSIQGAYGLLGQRCSVSTNACSVVTGEALIDVDGQMRLCVGQAYSETCAGLISVTLSAKGAEGAAARVWKLGASNGRLVADWYRKTVVFSYRDPTTNAAGDFLSSDFFVFFGAQWTHDQQPGYSYYKGYGVDGTWSVIYEEPGLLQGVAMAPSRGVFSYDQGLFLLGATPGSSGTPTWFVNWRDGAGLSLRLAN